MAGKKSFDFKNELKDEREKSTAAFITQAEELKEKRKNENRSARMNLSMPPSLKEDIELIAAKERRSVNTIINELLESYVDSHQAELEASREFFGK